ncbi:probable disease resistance RPP8-like protein 2 [Humulus lupulus]|uniref:probable disease resistance RPP8-like protein 2 n=1 Tax=Humulus lupulus TaxID=3486 RepID=UPI002B4082C6|nr:probable disease resistance RPP8-like protein 2 [Humulus lupulus]
MEWMVLSEVAGANLFGGSPLEENAISAGSPNFGLVLLTYFLEHQKDNRATTKANAFVDFNQIDAHCCLILSLTLFWHNVKNISLYQVLLCVLLIAAGIFIFVNFIAFQLLDNDIKWIRKESRLLRAIVDDEAAITSLSDQITAKGHQLWDPELDSGSSTAEAVGLTEYAWIKDASGIVVDADKLTEAFECRRKKELKLKRISLSFSSMIKYLSDIDELFLKTMQIKDRINSSFTRKKALELHICESQEKSWSVIRTLLNRPIEEHENKLVNSILQVGAGGLISSVLEKVEAAISMIDRKSLDSIKGQTVEMQLMLLCPFLQHIKGLRLESQIERVWLMDLDEIVSKAKAAIDTFSKVSFSCRGKWLRAVYILSVWRAKRKFKADLKCIDVSFSDLFERKEKYGFQFIIRDPSKSKHHYFHETDFEVKFPSLIRNFRSYLKKQSLLLGWVSDKLMLICDQMEKMLNLLDNANSTAAIQNIRQAWSKQMENIVMAAFKSTTTFVEKAKSTNTLLNTRARLQLSREIDQIKHHMCILERSITAYSGELRDESSLVVGLEEDVEAVVSQLTTSISEHQNCDNTVDIFSIVGMEGIGKTTLAKKIYSHRAIMAHFPIRVWLSVPQDYDDQFSFLNDVIVQVMDQRGLILQEKLEHYKQKIDNFPVNDMSFLVLDNISTKEVFYKLMERMPLGKTEGSRILITSQNENVASVVDPNQRSHPTLKLRLRTTDESLGLLKQMVYITSNEETIAQDIVRRCLGLPLSIVRVGYMMLKQNATASEALATLPLLKSSFIETVPKKFTSDIQKLLEHFEIFPKDFDIPVRRLVTLWVSEGLVEQSGDDNETLEQIAEKQLYKLIDQGIVQMIQKKTSGKVKTCRFPCTNEPRYLQFSHDSPQKIKHLQRLAHHFNKNGLSLCLIHSDNDSKHDDLGDLNRLHSFLPFDPRQDDEPRDDIGCFLRTGNELQDGSTKCSFELDYKNLHTFLTFDPREGEEPGETIGSFLCKGIQRGHFQQLKVLDLEGVFKPELPNSIGKLRRLKYLGLRWTYLQKIPSCIGDLVQLETLDVKHTYVRSLPSSVWKLQRLRNLYLPHSNRCKFMHHPRGNSLKKLQTLWGVFVDKDSPLKDCLDKSNDLRKLAMVFQLDVSEQEKLSSQRMSKLKRLQTLRLRSIDETGKPNKLFLNLSNLTNLSSIELFGRLENPVLINELPDKLTELTLSASALSDDPMPKLEKLPNLKQLYFYSGSYKGARMVCSNDGFPQLIDLKIWKIKDLEELIIEDKALQKLRDLEIRGCERLTVPDGLKNLKKLAELKLTDMPEEFARKIVRDQKLIWGDITQSPLINILDKDS